MRVQNQIFHFMYEMQDLISQIVFPKMFAGVTEDDL